MKFKIKCLTSLHSLVLALLCGAVLSYNLQAVMSPAALAARGAKYDYLISEIKKIDVNDTAMENALLVDFPPDMRTGHVVLTPAPYGGTKSHPGSAWTPMDLALLAAQNDIGTDKNNDVSTGKAGDAGFAIALAEFGLPVIQTVKPDTYPSMVSNKQLPLLPLTLPIYSNLDPNGKAILQAFIAGNVAGVCATAGYNSLGASCGTNNNLCCPGQSCIEGVCDVACVPACTGSDVCIGTTCVTPAACAANADCTVAGLTSCNLSTSKCVLTGSVPSGSKAQTGADCTTGYRDAASQLCAIKPCAVNSDCTVAGLKSCNISTGVCITTGSVPSGSKAQTGADCTTGYLDPASQLCATKPAASCTTDAGCKVAGLKSCNISSATCVATGSVPVGSKAQLATDCISGYLDAVSKLCAIKPGAGCTKNADCTVAGTNSCDLTTHKCVATGAVILGDGCQTHPDCTSGYCNAGVCTDDSQTACMDDDSCSGINYCDSGTGACTVCKMNNPGQGAAGDPCMSKTDCLSCSCNLATGGCD